MSYVATNWTAGVTPGSQTNMNHLESQYLEASLSFERDLFTPFVFSGLVCTKDLSIANQLNVTAGVAFLRQNSDNTLRRQTPVSSTQTTATPSTTYYLFLKTDGTFQWGTSSSGPSNSIAICQATTDGSGNINVVTDVRQLTTTFLSGFAGLVTMPTFGQVTATRFLTNGTLGAANQITDYQQGYRLFSDNTASTFAGATARLWLDANATTNTREVHIGPRVGGDALAGFRVLTNNVTFSPGTAGSAGSPGVLSVLGGMKLSFDQGRVLSDGGGTISDGSSQAVPSNGMLAALTAGVNLGTGAYKYLVTFITSLGETLTNSSSTNITTTGGNQAVNLTVIPTAFSNTAIIGRNIYRTKVGGSTYFLLTTINDNTTTTYSDTTADASLPATNPPVHPSIGGIIFKNAAGSVVGQIFSDGAISFDAGAITSDGAGKLSAGGFNGPYGTIRSGSLTYVEVYTGAGTPSGDGVTAPRTGALWAKA